MRCFVGLQGRAEVYACCPRCKSKAKIDSDEAPLCLERWVVEYQSRFFKGRRPGLYSHIALASVIRHNFSNYDDLIFQLEAKSLRCNSHPKEVMAAHQSLRERFDRQICKLLGRCSCGQVLRDAQEKPEG